MIPKELWQTLHIPDETGLNVWSPFPLAAVPVSFKGVKIKLGLELKLYKVIKTDPAIAKPKSRFFVFMIINSS